MRDRNEDELNEAADNVENQPNNNVPPPNQNQGRRNAQIQNYYTLGIGVAFGYMGYRRNTIIPHIVGVAEALLTGSLGEGGGAALVRLRMSLYLLGVLLGCGLAIADPAQTNETSQHRRHGPF